MIFLFGLTRLTWKFFLAYKRQKRYLKQFLIPLMSDLEVRYNGKFSDTLRKRILTQYALPVPALVCEAYTHLWKKKISAQEREIATYMGVFSALFDDFFDESQLSEADIEKLCFDTIHFQAKNFEEKVAKEIYLKMIPMLAHPDIYVKGMKNVFSAHIDSTKQLSSNVSIEELWDITYAKGYYSLILYHYILNTLPTPTLEKVMQYGGNMIQMTNDIYDVRKDLIDNIKTLPLQLPSLQAFYDKIIADIKSLNFLCRQLETSKKEKKVFQLTINAIVARGLVAVDQLKRLQQKKGSINLETWSRKELITDMEKPIKILKWIKYTYKLYHLP